MGEGTRERGEGVVARKGRATKVEGESRREGR